MHIYTQICFTSKSLGIDVSHHAISHAANAMTISTQMHYNSQYIMNLNLK
jgi:hypothetical protein